MTYKRRRASFFFALALLLCVVPAAVAFGMGVFNRTPQITVGRQEARLSPALVGVCSIFMKIQNAGSGDDTLLSARADLPGAVTELHNVIDGKMVKADKIRIPSKSVVEMRPMSLHIMVFKLPGEIKEGSEFALYLTFEKSGEKKIQVRIVKR